MLLIKMNTKPKLIDSGSYGCVVMPPVKDNIIKIKKTYTNKRLDDIGKIFKTTINSKQEAKNEYKTFLNSAKNIKYYKDIVPEIKGYNILSKIDNDEINNCIKAQNASKTEIHQLIYKNAGTTFHNLPYNFITFQLFIKAFRTFAKKFKYYIEYGKIHSDINEKNIMIYRNTIMLIDFGLEKTKDNIYNNKNLKFFEYNYVYYPPEFRYLYLYYTKSKKSINNKVEFVYKNFEMFKKYFTLDVMSEEYIKKEIKELINNFNLDYKKMDIFALGINFVQIRDKIHFADEKELERFNYLVKKMIEPNPSKRFSKKEIIKYAK
mgnify:CR=1 FL=1